MKTYIYGLLRKKVFSNEAKYLMEVLTQYYKEFHYTDFNSFECFYFHISSDCPYYGFFHEVESYVKLKPNKSNYIKIALLCRYFFTYLLRNRSKQKSRKFIFS